MNKFSKGMAIVGLGLAATFGLSACGGGPAPAPTQKEEVKKKAAKAEAYLPKNTVELDNYNKAQKIYDNPASIQWCTAFPSQPSAPIITVPIAGKLTTSATSYFSPTDIRDRYESQMNIPARSVDGLFHGDSFYRYGFSPSGIMYDFSNSLELICSTGLTEYQRQNTFIEGVEDSSNMEAKQKKAEAALEAGDSDKASDILAGK